MGTLSIMKWTTIQHLSKEQFKRSTGVSYEVFLLMTKTLEEANFQQRKHPSRGRQPSLSIEDKILLLLMYYREYRIPNARDFISVLPMG